MTGTYGTYFPGRGYTQSSRFGERWRRGRFEDHRGIDFAAREGTPVRAAADGEVVYRGTSGRVSGPGAWGYGNVVVPLHRDAAGRPLKYTVYAHLNTLDGVPARGEKVYKGDVIGQVGNTGGSDNPHLHYSELHARPPRDTIPMNEGPNATWTGFQESDYAVDPAVPTDFGPSGVYHDTGRDLGIIHRTDRFYPRDLARPLYDSNRFTKDTSSTAALVDVTPLYDSENVRPTDPARLTRPRPLDRSPGAPPTIGERLGPFDPGPPVPNTLGDGFNMLDPRPGVPLLPSPGRTRDRTQYPFNDEPNRFASANQPTFGQSMPQQPSPIAFGGNPQAAAPHFVKAMDSVRTHRSRCSRPSPTPCSIRPRRASSGACWSSSKKATSGCQPTPG